VELTPHTPYRAEVTASANDAEQRVAWTEEEIVQLHCDLLADISVLADPATPLEEKLDTLRWIFTEREKDSIPFSFADCVRIAGCSPLSTYPYFGFVPADDVRDLIRGQARRWLRETLERYPEWVQKEFKSNPDWFAERLSKNPQWVNQQIRGQYRQPDMFA
jgi:hypothetical protein